LGVSKIYNTGKRKLSQKLKSAQKVINKENHTWALLCLQNCNGFISLQNSEQNMSFKSLLKKCTLHPETNQNVVTNSNSSI
jgi:hypothetical protein